MNPIQQAISALTICQGALSELSRCQSPECKQAQDEIIDCAEKVTIQALTSLRSLNKEVEGVELPPLPAPYTELYKDLYPVIYEAWSQQMRTYARTAIAAAIGREGVAAEYLIRARWPDGIEEYLHVRGAYDLGGGKVGIDVDAPLGHPLATQPTQAEAPSEREGLRKELMAMARREGPLTWADRVLVGRVLAALATQQADRGRPCHVFN
ncbi:MAG TPA: hypothetical protein VMA55_11935, partial [Acidovorax sp.]|nr:hypothetical protein [Acidovorax sp.]